VTEPDPPESGKKKQRRFSKTELTLFGLILMLSIGEGGARFLSPVYLADRGSAVGSIGLSLSMFGAAALAARLLVGSTFQATAVRLTVLTAGLASTVSLLLITTTSSIGVFTVLIGIHGVGWGVMATVLLALVIGGKEKRAAAAVIGFYIGIEGLGRTGSPILAGILGGAFGPSTGMRIHTVLFAVTVAVGLVLLRDAPALQRTDDEPSNARRFDIGRFRHVPLAAWVAALTGFYLNTTNALLNTFFPLLGLTLGFSLAQIGTLAGSRSAVSALVRFGAHRAFDRIPFRIQFVPLYLLNAMSASLIGVVTFYPAQFLLFVPNGASRGVLRVGSMANAMEDSEETSAGATAALIGAGYDVGRIIGPAVGGLVAAAVGLSTMFVTLPLVFVGIILPMALWTRRRH
jgi:predicted MFS family arabinose efflux permease